MNQQETAFEQMRAALVGGDQERVCELARRAAETVDVFEIIQDGLSPAMKTIGDQFAEGEIFLPELLEATDSWNAAMKVLQPKIDESGKTVQKLGTVILGTVQTDIHGIGKDVVKHMMEISGFTVCDLGTDVPATTFVAEAVKQDADIIAASSIMTTTMPFQADIIEYLQTKGLRDKYLVMVGGGVVNQQWADEIGADGYGALASDAVNVARQLIAARREGR